MLPQGRIKEAMETQKETVERAVRDIVYIGQNLSDIGCDGINLDTTGAAEHARSLHPSDRLPASTSCR